VGEQPSQLASPRVLAHHGCVTIIKINAITVPAEGGDELAKRFGARAGAVDGQEGFEGFELLRPTDDRTTWLVITRWRDQQSYDAWVASPSFAHGHRGSSGSEGQGGGQAATGGEGHGGGESSGPPPMAMTSELWSYDVEIDARPTGD
jgi:heme-degrading monooxygenase HmoA